MNASVSDIFNSAIVACGISAFDELGLLEELQDEGSIDVAALCADRELHAPSIKALILGLHKARIVALDEDRGIVVRGPLFGETLMNKAYFLWLVRGYGHMLANMATLVQNKHRNGAFIQRDGDYIALPGRNYGARFVDGYFDRVLREEPFRVAADLGCGSANRLMELAKERPDFRGVGVELNCEAVERATRTIEAQKLTGRVTVVQGDVKHLAPRPEYEEVDVIFSFFMGHDLWPREKCLECLDRIQRVFPNAKRFLLSDTYRSDLAIERGFPIFTYGFEMTHAIMGQSIPTISEWLELFEESPWTCVKRKEIGIPFSCIFDLRR